MWSLQCTLGLGCRTIITAVVTAWQSALSRKLRERRRSRRRKTRAIEVRTHNLITRENFFPLPFFFSLLSDSSPGFFFSVFFFSFVSVRPHLPLCNGSTTASPFSKLGRWLDARPLDFPKGSGRWRSVFFFFFASFFSFRRPAD